MKKAPATDVAAARAYGKAVRSGDKKAAQAALGGMSPATRRSLGQLAESTGGRKPTFRIPMENI